MRRAGRRVEIEFHRAALALCPAGTAVLAAVSGGGDSVALLHLLARFAPPRELRLVVGHLDHGLRRGSAADRRFVERLARSLGLPCHAERREVAARRRRDESPEEGARRVRREFLLEAAQANGCELVATGHTLDDQAETVLLRLVRGAGAAALGAMAPRGPGPFVRPLLELERQELRAWLRRRRLPFREDPTNRDLRFDRNRLRLLLLPLLQRWLNPRAARHLVDAAARLRADAGYLDDLAAARFAAAARRDRRGRWLVRPEALGAGDPLDGRVARLALLHCGVDPRRVGSRHVAALLDLAAGPRGRACDLPGGIVARRLDAAVALEPC